MLTRQERAQRVAEKREKFEKWFHVRWPGCSIEWYEPMNRYYYGTHTQPAWEAWQESRIDLEEEVERLRKRDEPAKCEHPNSREEFEMHFGYVGWGKFSNGNYANGVAQARWEAWKARDLRSELEEKKS